MKRALAIFALSLAATIAHAADGPVPGVVFAQTARTGVTVTPAGKDAKPQPLKPGETFAAAGQMLDAPANAALALILSNGDSFFLPLGGRITLDEFSQDPVSDTGRQRDYEPSRSALRINLAQGTFVASGRQPLATSSFVLTTPMARFDCQSPSFVVAVSADQVTFTLLSGTAEVTIPETGHHETLQAGQMAILTRANLRDNFPLKVSAISTADSRQFNNWLTAASTAESRLTFTGMPGHLKPTQLIPQVFTQQMSVDDPRYRKQ